MYGAIALSVLVEALNIRAKSVSKHSEQVVHLHEPYTEDAAR